MVDQGVPTSGVAPAPAPGGPVVPGTAAPMPGVGEETTPPGGPVPGAPEPQPLPDEAAAAAPAVPAGADKVETILAVVAFLVTAGATAVLALLKVE
jgi:hypothetical protein